jgi:23S rRNA (uracil1939-C5)-methyltransferase
MKSFSIVAKGFPVDHLKTRENGTVFAPQLAMSDSTSPLTPEMPWQQGHLVEVTITDLSDSGDGVGRSGQQVVFVPDTVTGDRAIVRLLRVKPQYAIAKLDQLLEPSPHRVRPSCIVADKCGGCQWQHVHYAYQLEAKQNLVIQAMRRLGGFEQPPVAPVLASQTALNYRNKATYPIGRSPTGQVQAGYYQKGSHHIVNLNQCPIQDDRLNPLLAAVKQDIQQRGWSIYQETQHRGKLRHLALRIGRHTGEMLLTLVSKESGLVGLEEQAQAWCDRYESLVGVCLNLNPDRTNAIFGQETRCLAGQAYLQETFAGLTFHIRPDTFFQIHTEQAEALLNWLMVQLNLQGQEVLLDAYSGIGTLTLPLARQVSQAIGVELQPEAVEQAAHNATLNHLDNVTFHPGAVETVLPGLAIQPDVVVLDPPRKGCDAAVLETLLARQPRQIAYVSCNPATLARDLKHLCQGDRYRITHLQPVDFFPQTAHVECVALLKADD